MISASEDETAIIIKAAKTDAECHITYDPAKRPEVSNLLLLASLCTNEDPHVLASKIGDGGASLLKSMLSEALNEYLRLIRKRRKEIEKEPDFIKSILKKGTDRAREIARKTLVEVRQALGMVYVRNCLQPYISLPGHRWPLLPVDSNHVALQNCWIPSRRSRFCEPGAHTLWNNIVWL